MRRRGSAPKPGAQGGSKDETGRRPGAFYVAMDPRRWSADTELPLSRVRQLISSQFAELRGAPVRPLGEGWDNRAFEVGGWVFRFPKRVEIQASLARERCLLPALSRLLPIPIPVPRYFGGPSELFPYAFLGYRMLEGTPLQSCLERPWSRSGEQRIAKQLGQFLSALHALEPARFGIELPRGPQRYLTSPLDDASDNLPHLAAEDIDLHTRLQRLLRQLRPASVVSLRPVLAHGDLDAEHLLLDTQRERLIGVIDWADVQLAVPATDFVGIHGLRGRRFSELVLRHYRGPVGSRDLPWIAQRQIALGLRNLAYARMTNNRSYLTASLAALRNAVA